MSTLIAKTATKEIVVCSDVESDEFHSVFGTGRLSDEEAEYVEEELGKEYTLEVVEEY
jgi:hypothetical protein